MGQSSTSKQAEQIQLSTAQSQLGLEQQYAQMAQDYLSYAKNLEQPFVSRNMALTSGSPTAAISAAGPQLGQIAQAGQAAKENIYNTVAPGAGRDVALSQLPMQTYSQQAGYLNNLVNSAFGNLAQLGSAQQGVGLNLAGAGISSGGLSTQSAGQVAQTEQQKKASTMDFVGSLINAAGSAAGGGAFGHL